MIPPKIFLFQVRESTDPVIAEEIAIFARNTGVPRENIIPHNLLKSVPSLEQIRKHDAVMIGGSGEYFVSRGNLPQFPYIMELLANIVEAGHPMFASCFGYQLIVRALGGEVSYTPDTMELGTYRLTLTDAGKEDELFQRLPPVFCAQLGHKDKATAIPKRIQNLAFSELAPFQALRIPKKPIWATQFHPELNWEENLGRLKRYIDLYTQVMTPNELKETIERFKPSPETPRLIPGFMKLVFDY
jgi:GMP synthase (glutamine-hydrolysing)